jgi:hypothetical protein
MSEVQKKYKVALKKNPENIQQKINNADKIKEIIQLELTKNQNHEYRKLNTGIADFKDLYEICNCGEHVRNIRLNNREMTIRNDGFGLKEVNLSTPGQTIKKKFKIHNLMMMTFYQDIFDNKIHEIIHVNSNSLDNHLENLRFQDKVIEKITCQFKPVILPKFPEFNNIYEVCDCGKHIKNIILEHYLKPYKRDDGYFEASLRNGDFNKNIPVHQIVCNAWHEKLDEKLIVDHINRIKDDNHKDNLRFTTYSENNKNKDPINYLNEDKIKHINKPDEIFKNIGKFHYYNKNSKEYVDYDLSEFNISNYGTVTNSGGYPYSINAKDGKYKMVQLVDKISKKRKSILIQVLVGHYFLDKPSDFNENMHSYEIRFLDNDPMNLHYTNLEWITHKENSLLKNGVQICMIDPNTNEEKIFRAYSEASEYLKNNKNIKSDQIQRSIRSVLNGYQETAYGYKWKLV